MVWRKTYKGKIHGPKHQSRVPARKTKIYAYLEALVGESKKQKAKIKEENRDYRNKDHWNLDPAHPPLQPLKAFLDPFFSTPQ